MRFLSCCAVVMLLFVAVLGIDGPARRSLPDHVTEELAQQAPFRYDEPDRARDFEIAKRLGHTTGVDPRAEYDRALRHVASMPRHSSRRERLISPAADALEAATGALHLDSWTPLGPGNIGGRTRALLIDPRKPKRMYAAGVSGGVWKSTNGGRRWRPVGDELLNLAVNALAFDPHDPDTIYAGTGEGFFREQVRETSLPLRGAGIFVSHDRGGSWERLPSTKRAKFQWVNDLVVSRHDSSRIYAATRAGVFRSKNGGATWKRVLRPRTLGGCLDLAARTDRDTDYLFASCGTLDQATVYRKPRAERGGRWTAVLAEEGMGRTSLAIAPSNQDIVYALAASNVPGPGLFYEQSLHAVFRSDDSGSGGSWQATVRNSDERKINTLLLSNPLSAFVEECSFGGTNSVFGMGWYVNVIAVDPVDPDRVWAAGVDLLRSDDGGRNWNPATYWWTQRGNRNFVHADHHALVFHPRKKKTLFSLNDGGIYRTRNAAAPVSSADLAVCDPGSSSVVWESLNNGYAVTQFYHGTPSPDGRFYIAGAQDNGTVMGRDEDGPNQWQPILGGDGGYSAIDPTDTNRIYATTQNGIIHRSTDGGRSFLQANNGINDLGGSGSFRAVATNYLFISPLVMDPSDPQTLWTGGRRLWRTVDGTLNWRMASRFLSDGGKVSAIAVSPAESGTVVVGTNGGSIYRSSTADTDTGDSVWPRRRPRSGFVSSVTFDPVDPAVVYATYAGFGGKHVWRSLDGAESWQSIDGTGATGLPNIPVHSLVVDPEDRDRLYVGTDLGVFASIDGGANWAIEITGFARAVTEWLSLVETVSGERYLFAFTHGRGAWRVELE